MEGGFCSFGSNGSSEASETVLIQGTKSEYLMLTDRERSIKLDSAFCEDMWNLQFKAMMLQEKKN